MAMLFPRGDEQETLLQYDAHLLGGALRSPTSLRPLLDEPVKHSSKPFPLLFEEAVSTTSEASSLHLSMPRKDGPPVYLRKDDDGAGYGPPFCKRDSHATDL